MRSISKNMYINKLGDIVNKYNNTSKTIKINPVDIKSNRCILTLLKKITRKIISTKFKVVDHLRIWKYKKVLTKGNVPNWSEEVFVIKKLIVLCHGHIISDSNSEKNIERFDEKELPKTNQKVFRVEKIIKRKWEKLYVN